MSSSTCFALMGFAKIRQGWLSGACVRPGTKPGGYESKWVEDQLPVAAREVHSPITAQFEFEAFKPLPCGCVAAMHRTLDPGLCVVSLEAKGPYCAEDSHVVGRVSAVPSAVTSEIGFPELEED